MSVDRKWFWSRGAWLSPGVFWSLCLAVVLGLPLATEASVLTPKILGQDLLNFLEKHPELITQGCPGGNSLGDLIRFANAPGADTFFSEENCELRPKETLCTFALSDRPLEDPKRKAWTVKVLALPNENERIQSVTCTPGDGIEPSAGSREAEADHLFSNHSSMEECERAYNSSEVQSAPTSRRRGLELEASRCFRRAMESKLDARLIPLKKSDPVGFKSEMAIQKNFNGAVSSFCGAWDRYFRECCSTCNLSEKTQCERMLYRWRVQQSPLWSVSQKSASLPFTAADEKTRVARTFASMADKICRLPAQHWSSGGVPASCRGQVLVDLAQAVRGYEPKASCSSR